MPSSFRKFWIHKKGSSRLNLPVQNIGKLFYPSKLAKFLSYFTQHCNFPGGATFEKHEDPKKKNRNSRKSRANCRNLLELLRFRKEENLYMHFGQVEGRGRRGGDGSEPKRGTKTWAGGRNSVLW